MAASILSVATAVPGYRLEAAAALAELTRTWPQLGRLAGTEAGLGTRYTCEPLDRVVRHRGLTELRNSYLQHATRLASTAARTAMTAGGVEGPDIDMIITVSCTGYLVPSLDVHLAAELELRSDVLRLPITELGCSGGAAAIALAHRHLRAFPTQRVLVIAVEVPSLSFRPDDRSLDNLTACLVFGDGAGAVVMGGPAAAGGRLEVLTAASQLIPGTAGLLGFELDDGGFRVVLDRRLPRVLERELGPTVDRFLSEAGVRTLDFVAAHAAGPRIFEAVESALALRSGALDLSREVFAEVGNTSSAAIFFTLEKLVERLGPTPASGLGLGFGPGVSIELMHLAWTPLKKARDEAGAFSEGLPVGG